MSDFSTRKEPSVSGRSIADFDKSFADDADILLDESVVGGETLVAENRRTYSSLPLARKKKSSAGMLLLVAGVCLGGVLWLVSRSGSNTPQPILAPLSVAPSTSAPMPSVAVVASPVVMPPQPAPQASSPSPQVTTEVRSVNTMPPADAVQKPVPSKSEIVKKEVAKKEVAKKKAAIEKNSTKQVGAVKWKESPERFTVQLVAAFSESGVKRIQAQLPATTPNTIHRVTKEGRPWFVLVYGSYASKQEAAKAQAQLPAALKKDLKPWVRKQGEVFGSKG